MKPQAWIALLLGLLAAGWASAGEIAPPNRPGCPPDPCFWRRVRPAGGWCPYGGPLCWWNPHCFPCCGAPDDYCRKKLPDVCWPHYPPWYIFGPPQDCYPQGGCSRPGNQLR